MPIANIPSVLELGILSHNHCERLKLPHSDVSMEDVQNKRDGKDVPGGLKLHEYANLYFHARNPMMSARRGVAARICVLQISIEVLKIEGVVITDQNAASKYVRFRHPGAMHELDFEKIYARDWKHPDDQIAEWRHSSMKCAEVLVPNSIDPGYIKGAYVVSAAAEDLLKDCGFTLPIKIEPDLFFA